MPFQLAAISSVLRVANGKVIANGSAMRRMTPAVAGLLTINILVFLAGVFLRNGDETLVTAGAIWFPANEHFRVWQVVTYMFLHGSPGHIFFNMFGLVSFGKILEAEWGAPRFLVFYFLCGIGAALIQTGINWQEYTGLHARLVAAGMTPAAIEHALATGFAAPADPGLNAMLVQLYDIHVTRTVGASGAIYGVLVAFGFLHPNAKLAIMFVPVPVAAKYVIPGLLALDFFSGVTGFSLFGGSVAHFAHVGGGAIGFLLMLLWRNRSRRLAASSLLREQPPG
jgi:membrane associated rhomboid family serine protease